MTTKSQPKSARELPFNGEGLVSYLDQLAEQQQKLGTAVKSGLERSQRISTQLVEASIAGQHELLELTKKVVQKPQDYSGNIKAVIDASTVAQGRVLELAKTLYREQAEAVTALRSNFPTAFQTPSLSEAGKNIVNFWTKPR